MAKKIQIDFRPAKFGYDVSINSERTNRTRRVVLVGKTADSENSTNVKLTLSGNMEHVDMLCHQLGIEEGTFLSATFKQEAKQKTLFNEPENEDEEASDEDESEEDQEEELHILPNPL